MKMSYIAADAALEAKRAQLTARRAAREQAAREAFHLPPDEITELIFGPCHTVRCGGFCFALDGSYTW